MIVRAAKRTKKDEKNEKNRRRQRKNQKAVANIKNEDERAQVRIPISSFVSFLNKSFRNFFIPTEEYHITLKLLTREGEILYQRRHRKQPNSVEESSDAKEK